MTRPPPASLSSPSSTVGQKALVAMTGVTLAAWTALHMAGNLLVFAGPDRIDRYGAMLQGSALVWLMRAVLVALVAVHAVHAVGLWRRARGARGPAPRRPRRRATSASARTMRLGGIAVACFVVYHVLHIFGVSHPDYRPGEVYHNVVTGLSDPRVAAVYLVATAAFCAHVHHGLASAARSVGISRGWARSADGVARFVAAVLLVGFAAPCLAAATGLLRP